MSKVLSFSGEIGLYYHQQLKRFEGHDPMETIPNIMKFLHLAIQVAYHEKPSFLRLLPLPVRK